MKYALPLILGALTLVACGQQSEPTAPESHTGHAASSEATPPAADVAAGTVSVTNAWCRPTPNGAKVAGCYATLTAGSDDVLKAIVTDLATLPQIHEMKHEDGMMKMAELKDGLALPAGTVVELKPGSNHMMLMGLKAPLVEGETAKLTFQFEKAPAVTVEAAVRTPPMIDSEE